MKYVFWIHSSTSYYMAKAIIAKENLDCHNVVYLIDRNYANKYHNNIDIEIEDISFWMNKFYPMKIKTILNLRRIIKSFDCYISCLIADSFTVYIPQLTTPIFQLLITHHSCVGYHFMEEGLAYYKEPTLQGIS